MVVVAFVDADTDAMAAAAAEATPRRRVEEDREAAVMASRRARAAIGGVPGRHAEGAPGARPGARKKNVSGAVGTPTRLSKPSPFRARTAYSTPPP